MNCKQRGCTFDVPAGEPAPQLCPVCHNPLIGDGDAPAVEPARVTLGQIMRARALEHGDFEPSTVDENGDAVDRLPVG